MPEDARFSAPAGHPAGAPADEFGFFAPVGTTAPGTAGFGAPPSAAPFTPGQPSALEPFGTAGPFGASTSDAPATVPPPSAYPVWAVAVFGAGALVALAIVAAIVIPVFLNDGQPSRLTATSLTLPPVMVGLPRSADPASQSQAEQLGAFIPSDFTGRLSAGYVAGSSTLVVAAGKPSHVMTFAEQAALTRSFWAHEANSAAADGGLGAPSTPAGAGATGTLTCADELTSDGSATVCVDAQATALVVFVINSTSGMSSDPTAPAQISTAVVHVG
jgi:hypothetical protein